LYGRLGGPHCQSGQVQKILPPPEFHPQTIQPVDASPFTVHIPHCYIHHANKSLKQFTVGT
jgi:hypothetical protein